MYLLFEPMIRSYLPTYLPTYHIYPHNVLTHTKGIVEGIFSTFEIRWKCRTRNYVGYKPPLSQPVINVIKLFLELINGKKFDLMAEPAQNVKTMLFLNAKLYFNVDYCFPNCLFLLFQFRGKLNFLEILKKSFITSTEEINNSNT